MQTIYSVPCPQMIKIDIIYLLTATPPLKLSADWGTDWPADIRADNSGRVNRADRCNHSRPLSGQLIGGFIRWWRNVLFVNSRINLFKKGPSVVCNVLSPVSAVYRRVPRRAVGGPVPRCRRDTNMRQIFSVKHPAFTYHLHLTNQSSLKPLKCLCKKAFHFCLIATLIIDNIIEFPEKCHPILSPVKARGWFWQPYKLVWLSKYESPRATRAVCGCLGTRELGPVSVSVYIGW